MRIIKREKKGIIDLICVTLSTHTTNRLLFKSIISPIVVITVKEYKNAPENDHTVSSCSSSAPPAPPAPPAPASSFPAASPTAPAPPPAAAEVAFGDDDDDDDGGGGGAFFAGFEGLKPDHPPRAAVTTVLW